MPRSTFGAQHRSTWRNPPCVAFGTCTRTQASKVWISASHTATLARGTQSADAFYSLPQSVRVGVRAFGFGKAQRLTNTSAEGLLDPAPGHYQRGGQTIQLSKHRRAPCFAFADARRDDARKLWAGDLNHQRRDLIGRDSPGPATYDSRSLLGTRSTPQFTLAQRPKSAPADEGRSPGPIYKARRWPTDASGEAAPQTKVDSTQPRVATPSMRGATRAERARVYVPKMLDKGRHSPGPAYGVSLDASACFGRQVRSQYPSGAKCHFSKEGRFAADERALARQYTPGPGSYENI